MKRLGQQARPILFLAMGALTVMVNPPVAWAQQHPPASSVAGETESPAAKSWQQFAAQLGDVGVRVHQAVDSSRNELQQAEVNESLLWSLYTGALYMAQMDPDHPQWLPYLNNAHRSPSANPDNVYSLTRIHGNGTYRITGTRGTVKQIILLVSDGTLGFPNEKYGENLGGGQEVGQYNFDDFKIADNGRFEILASASRPAGYTENWVGLDPTVSETFLLLRQISSGWSVEEDGRFAIQRIDRPIEPVAGRNEINQRLADLPRYVEEYSKSILWMLQSQRFDDRPTNEIEDYSNTFGSSGLVKSQVYSGGKLRVGTDQALILEASPAAQCRYWSVQLLDSFYSALDYAFQQSGLNAHTARIDPDGKIRLVMSQRDPGVPNWLNKGDYEQNAIRFRWQACGSPKITTRLVPFAQVRNFLPKQTPVVSVEQRQDAIRQRVEAVQLRRHW